MLSNHSKPVIRALEDYISAPVMLLLNFAEKYMRNMGTFMKEKIGSTEERNLGKKKSNIYLPLEPGDEATTGQTSLIWTLKI